MSIKVYTDGACRGNPGPGGWGVYIQLNDEEKDLYGGNPETTNNQMEMQAALEALKYLKDKNLCDHFYWIKQRKIQACLLHNINAYQTFLEDI